MSTGVRHDGSVAVPPLHGDEWKVVLQNGQVLTFKTATVEFDFGKPALTVTTERTRTTFFWPFVAYYVCRFPEGEPPPPDSLQK